jgi:hypothetical protein
MAHVRSTVRSCDDAAIAEGEGRDSAGSAERTKSAGASDADSQPCPR